MPRSQFPVAVLVVNYFKTANLEAAELVFAMAKNVLKERQAEAAEATTANISKPKRAKPTGPRKERADKGKPRGRGTSAEEDPLLPSLSGVGG